MGFVGSASNEKRQVLPMLLRTLPRHHFQHHHAKKNPVPYSQPHYSLRGHLLPHGSSFLPAIRQRRENNTLHLHSAFTNSVFPTTCRNHSTYLPGRTTHRKILTFHHDLSDAIHHRYCDCPKCTFSLIIYTHHVTLGPEGVFEHPSSFVDHA